MDRAAQRKAALAKANETRMRRAELKRQIACGEYDARQLLVGDPPDVTRTAQIGEVLTWFPRVGAKKAGQMLRRLGLSGALPLERVSPSTRMRILDLLP